MLGIDTTDPASFTDANATDPQVRRLIERVVVSPDPRLRTTQARVKMSRAGSSASGEYDSGVPASDLVAQGAKLRAKFAGLVDPLLGAEAKALADRIEHVADLPSARGLLRSA
jgi:hypothetical protein